MSLLWKPHGWLAWILTVAAACLAAAVAQLGLAMAYPVTWGGPGRYASAALFFPLHLLVGTLPLGGLAVVAARLRAPLAAVLFGLSAALTVIMAGAPMIALASAARELRVPLSFQNYLENARRWNVGAPVRERSVAYGVAKDGTTLELDVWRSGKPNTGPLRPAVVLVHGGGWKTGNRGDVPDWNRWLNTLGYEVFDVEYRLPPPARWLDQVGDVKSALGWVLTHARDYHVDPEQISLMGRSAGGNLALLAAYSMGDPRLPPSTDVSPVAIHSVINFFGPTDLPLLFRNSPNPHQARATLETYVGGTLEDFPDRYRLLSPLTHVSSRAPPTITLTGARDRLVSTEHARLLDETLKRAGVPHELFVLPATDHAFDLNFGGFGTQIARAKLEAFLARHSQRRRTTAP